MLNTDAKWKSGIASNGRSFTYRIVVNGTDDIPAKSITSIEIDECGASEHALKCGEFCKNSVSFTVRTDAYTKWNGGYVQFFVSCNGSAEVPLGKYYIYKQELKDDGRYTEITGYDVPEYMLEKAAPSSHSVSEIVSAIEAGSGMKITNKSVFTLASIEAVPEGTTNMGLLGYIAGYNGYNLRTNRIGGIEAYKYEDSADMLLVPHEDLYPAETLKPGYLDAASVSPETGYVIPRKNTYQGSQSYAATPFNIDSVTVVSGDTSYTAGSGTGISYENPYITSADQIDRSYIHTKYIPLDNKWRGNPAVQIGDVLMVETAEGTYQRALVMEQKITVDGGLSATLCSYGETDAALAVESPTMREIKTVRKQLSHALVNALSVILGTGAGYFNFVDADGNVITDADAEDTVIAGWQITDSPIVGDTTRGWRFILGGLYYSADGFKTAKNFALTKDGQIVATSGVFGTDPNTVELRTNDAQTGVMFNGTGTVEYRTVGRFNAENISDITNQSASLIRMANDTVNSGRNYINLMNYNLQKTTDANTSDGYYKQLANAVYITANGNAGNGNTMRLQNYAEPESATVLSPNTANQILLSSTNNGANNSISLINYFSGANTNAANQIVLGEENKTNDGASSYVQLYNYSYNGKTSTNILQLYSNSATSYTSAGLYNYDVSGNQANVIAMESTSSGNKLRITNYLSSTETSQIEMRSDGYLGISSKRFYISVDQFDLYIRGSGYTGLSFINDGKGHMVLGKA